MKTIAALILTALMAAPAFAQRGVVRGHGVVGGPAVGGHVFGGAIHAGPPVVYHGGFRVWSGHPYPYYAPYARHYGYPYGAYPYGVYSYGAFPYYSYPSYPYPYYAYGYPYYAYPYPSFVFGFRW
jgi:hypothetical protein